MAGNRCDGCGKMASLELGDAEMTEMNVERDGASLKIGGSVRIVRSTECCSEEKKETTFDVDCDVEIEDALAKEHSGSGHESVDILNEEAEATERTETKDRNGKPIKSARYMTSLFGVRVTGDVVCECGDTLTSFEWSDEVAASSMDEL